MERRNFLRTSFEMHGWFDLGDDLIDFTVHDLSLKGCMVRLSRVPPRNVNRDVVVHLQLSEDIRIESTATLLSCQGQDCHLEFRVMDADSFAHLRRLMELNTADDKEITREVHDLPKPRKPE